MSTLHDSVGQADRLLEDIRQQGGLDLEDITEVFAPENGAALLRSLVRRGKVAKQDGLYVAVADDLETFRRKFLLWLEGQAPWLAMPHKQRGVIATAIKKHLHPEQGLTVGPKRMRREYRGKVCERTIHTARGALASAGLMISVPQKRPNGSDTTSARFPSPAFYGQLDQPLPEQLAEHLGVARLPVSRPSEKAAAAALAGRR